MVKYGKEYKRLQLDEWKKYYLNYKTLKHKIKEMRQILFKDLKLKPNEGRPSLLSIPLIPDDLNEIENTKSNENLSSLYKDEKGELLKEFIELLIQEFKKSYTFFVQIEKVLIKKMNTHLYTQTSYSTYSLSELSKEMKSLSLTVYLAKSLNGFINDIMMAIKKILKKFDKNFSSIYGVITPHLILQLLTKKNSELDYMLQFKIIDEITTISRSSSIKELKNYFDQNNDDSNADNEKYREEFIQKYNETLKYIEDIEELIYFKSQYKDWIDYIGRRNTIKKGYKYFENDIFNPILSSSYYKDNSFDKFLSTKEAFNEAKSLQNKITPENRRNMLLILLQTFFVNSLMTCIFPVLYYYEYIRSLGDEVKIYKELWFINLFLFFVISSAYLGQFFSIFFFYNYTSRRTMKFSFTLSYIFICFGSILYILSIFSKQGHFKVRALILGFSRTLVGLGSNPMIGKKYITIYSPRYYLPLISKIYLIVELSGFILGPLITALIIYIQIGNHFCVFNCIGYYGTFGALILIALNHYFFIPPYNENFLVFSNTKKADLNMSKSQSTEPLFENMEDSQDREFYRLQKEKTEKKNEKNKLEVTKSDEINIEINDNEPSKSGNNKTINNTVDSNVDEDRQNEGDDNYYKIMEKAGDMLGQNEIAENYYNNVDTGRYSDLDISSEQNETIKEVLEKLYQYQEKSNFTYINMMPRTLDDIILNEQKTFGNMNRNLLILLILLLFNCLIKENLIVHTSYFMLFKIYKNGDLITKAEEIHHKEINYTDVDDEINNSTAIDLNYFIEVINYFSNNTKINNSTDELHERLSELIFKYTKENKGDIQAICLITSLELLFQLGALYFIMPFYKINIVFKKNLIIFMSISVALILPFSFNFFNKHIYLYTIFISGAIFAHKIIEIICSCYLVYLIPPKWQYSHIRASSLPIYLMTFGKFCGCLLCLTSYNRNHIEYNHHFLTIIAAIIYGMIGLYIYKSKTFRISALSRIIKQNSLE